MRRTLPAPCRWLEFNDGGCGLYWHYGNLALLEPRNGKWHHVVKWRDKRFEAVAGSKAQAKRWIECWIAVQQGLPQKPRALRAGTIRVGLPRDPYAVLADCPPFPPVEPWPRPARSCWNG
jgi:hypothetical protein